MILYGNKGIILLIFISHIILLANSSDLPFQLIEQKEALYREISLSIQIMADEDVVERYSELLKISEGFENLVSELIIDDDLDCMHLNIFDPFESPTTIIFLKVVESNSVILRKCRKENIIGYTINIGKNVTYLS